MSDAIAEDIIERRKPVNRAALADLIENRATVSEIAHRLNVTDSAVHKMRRRFEISAGINLPRHEPRGRRPASLN